MNQVQFETAKKHCLFVMLPDGSTTPRLWNLHGETPYIAYKIDKIPYSEIIEFNGIDLQLQGFVSELTDEQKEGVCKDADEFASLLTSLNVLLVNPLQDEWDEVCTWGH